MEENYSIKYADIWRRAGAFVIDFSLAICFILSITFMSFEVLQMMGESGSYFAEHQYPIIIGSYVFIIVLILYNSLMDSSKRQGTLGKTVFKLKTVDMNHKRLSLWRALLKYTIMWLIPFLFGKSIIIVVLIMAIPIAFTSKRQGIYDMIAGSLVIKGDVEDVIIPNQNAIQHDQDVKLNE